MSEHMLKMVGLSREKVQSLLSGKGAPQLKSSIGYTKQTELKRHDKVAKAYEMIRRGSSVATACQSWGVRIYEVDQFAKTNNLPNVGTYHSRTESLSTKGYEIAAKEGMAKAVATVGVTRESIYAYARRYRLPSPMRARFQ
jgi:DNA-binding phage protein